MNLRVKFLKEEIETQEESPDNLKLKIYFYFISKI